MANITGKNLRLLIGSYNFLFSLNLEQRDRTFRRVARENEVLKEHKSLSIPTTLKSILAGQLIYLIGSGYLSGFHGK